MNLQTNKYSSHSGEITADKILDSLTTFTQELKKQNSDSPKKESDKNIKLGGQRNKTNSKNHLSKEMQQFIPKLQKTNQQIVSHIERVIETPEFSANSKNQHRDKQFTMEQLKNYIWRKKKVEEEDHSQCRSEKLYQKTKLQIQSWKESILAQFEKQLKEREKEYNQISNNEFFNQMNELVTSCYQTLGKKVSQLFKENHMEIDLSTLKNQQNLLNFIRSNFDRIKKDYRSKCTENYQLRQRIKEKENLIDNLKQHIKISKQKDTSIQLRELENQLQKRRRKLEQTQQKSQNLEQQRKQLQQQYQRQQDQKNRKVSSLQQKLNQTTEARQNQQKQSEKIKKQLQEAIQDLASKMMVVQQELHNIHQGIENYILPSCKLLGIETGLSSFQGKNFKTCFQIFDINQIQRKIKINQKLQVSFIVSRKERVPFAQFLQNRKVPWQKLDLLYRSDLFNQNFMQYLNPTKSKLLLLFETEKKMKFGAYVQQFQSDGNVNFVFNIPEYQVWEASAKIGCEIIDSHFLSIGKQQIRLANGDISYVKISSEAVGSVFNFSKYSLVGAEDFKTVKLKMIQIYSIY